MYRCDSTWFLHSYFSADYPDYNNTFSTSTSYFANVKYEDNNDEVEEKYRIPEGRPDQPPYNNYDSAQDYWMDELNEFFPDSTFLCTTMNLLQSFKSTPAVLCFQMIVG